MLPSLWPTKLSNNNRNTFELQKKKTQKQEKTMPFQDFPRLDFKLTWDMKFENLKKITISILLELIL